MSDPNHKIFITRKQSLTAGTFPNDFVDDVTDWVTNLKFEPSINSRIGKCTFDLTGGMTPTRYRFKDVVEIWVQDGSHTIGLPANILDITADGYRCFVGRIDSIAPIVTSNKYGFSFVVRSYAADLLESTPECRYFQSDASNLLTHMLSLLNAKRGSGLDASYNGQPGFLLNVVPFPALTVADVWFGKTTFYDAFAQIASLIDYDLLLDDSTYHPRAVGSATNRPTIVLTPRGGASVGTVDWAITEGINMISAKTTVDATECKNRVQLASKDIYGTKFIVTKEDDSSTSTEYGTDRFGKMEGYANQDVLGDYTSVDSLALQTLNLTKVHRQEFQFDVFPAQIDNTKPLAGSLITIYAPLVGIGAPTLYQILQASYTYSASGGLIGRFSVSHYNPTFGALIARPFKQSADKITSEVYSGFDMYGIDKQVANPYNGFRVTKYNPVQMSAGMNNIVSTEFTVTQPIVFGGGSFLYESDSNNWFSNYILTNCFHTLWRFDYTRPVIGGVTYGRIDVYDVLGGPVVMTGQTPYNAAGFIVVATGSGMTFQVTVSGAATAASANNRYCEGVDHRVQDIFYKGVIRLAYHRGFLYMLLSAPWSNGGTKNYVLIRKYTLTGTLVSTWAIGQLNLDGRTDEHICTGFAINPYLDTANFLMHFQRLVSATTTYDGVLRIGTWSSLVALEYKFNAAINPTANPYPLIACHGITCGPKGEIYWVDRGKLTSGTPTQEYIGKSNNVIDASSLLIPSNSFTRSFAFPGVAWSANNCFGTASGALLGHLITRGMTHDMDEGLFILATHNTDFVAYLYRYNWDQRSYVGYGTFSAAQGFSGFYWMQPTVCAVPLFREYQV